MKREVRRARKLWGCYYVQTPPQNPSRLVTICAWELYFGQKHEYVTARAKHTLTNRAISTPPKEDFFGVSNIDIVSWNRPDTSLKLFCDPGSIRRGNLHVRKLGSQDFHHTQETYVRTLSGLEIMYAHGLFNKITGDRRTSWARHRSLFRRPRPQSDTSSLWAKA